MAINDSDTGNVIAAAIEVHRSLGHGFLEAVYQEALAKEFMIREIPFCAQVPMRVYYKGERLGCGYRADFVCYRHVLVELKAQLGLTEIDEAQVINYLRATDFERALLLNFGAPRLEIKRLILTSQYRDGQPQSVHRKQIATEGAEGAEAGIRTTEDAEDAEPSNVTAAKGPRG